ncbi:hypothetical protein [Oceanobacter kriegii]|uniref:hypothetical protein n=1 Tax=Oceanobacter kriegii TaxID=64972 RepID=UPI0004263188|nr:hypothetical protein [Oceanobacter kriegii]
MNYQFTLNVSGATPETEDFEDKLFEAGCDDALVCFYGSNPYLEFDREADSAYKAITSAIADVQEAGYQVVSIEEAGQVTLSGAAHHSQISKQALNNYARGKRGPGGFPAPCYGLQTGTPLYSWLAITDWLVRNGKAGAALAEVAGAAVQIETTFHDSVA